MKRHLPLALATLLLMGAALPAMAADETKPVEDLKAPPPHNGGPGKERGERGAKMFEQADANKDGQLTKEEMIGAHQQRIDKMFVDLDADKNGQLSKAELDKGRDKMRAEMKERLKERRKDGPAGEGGEDRPDGPPPGDHPPEDHGDKPE